MLLVMLLMSPEYPTLELVSHEEFHPILGKFKLLLQNLPVQLPLGRESESAFCLFLNYVPDAELLDKTGCEVSTLSEQN